MVDVLRATEVLGGVLDTSVERSELIPRHVGELVVSYLVGKTLGVGGRNELVVFFPCRVFTIDFGVRIFLVEEFHPALETSAGFNLSIINVEAANESELACRRHGGEGQGNSRFHNF